MSIKESTRKLFDVGKYSKAVTVPIDWVKFNEWLRKEELRELHCSVNDILVMSPEEKKEKVRKFLLLYERLSSEEVDRLLKLFERLSPEEIDRLLTGGNAEKRGRGGREGFHQHDSEVNMDDE